MKALRLVGLGLLASVVAIRDDLQEKTLEKDSAHPSALVELKDAVKNNASSKSAGRTSSKRSSLATGQTAAHAVRSGKGRHHHRHAPAEGHHHHRHKHHHHARRHHEYIDDESTEDDRAAAAEDGSLEGDERARDDDDRVEDRPRHRSHRKEPEMDDEAEVDEDEQEWEDEEDEPPRLPGRHQPSHSAKEDQEDSEEKRERATSHVETETAKKVEQVVATAATPKMPANPIMEAVAPSQPAAGPLDVLRIIWSWVLPCFGWTIVIALVVLVALRIKWPELSNVGVHYVAKKMSLSGRRKEAPETGDKKEAQKANEKPSAPAVSA